MKIKALVGFALGLMSTSSLANEVRYTVFQQNGFSVEAAISQCTSGCSRQMAVVARYDFLFNGDYNQLLETLEAFGMRISIYEGQWADADQGEVLMKVSSTIHQRQRWRRANQRRKMETPNQMAEAIYASIPAGTMVTLEFQQEASPLTGSDFTINVRRYASEALISTGSRAVAPAHDGNNYTNEQ